MTSKEYIRALIYGAVRAPAEELHGASAEELAELQARLGHALPAQLAELLAICNGAGVGPGGLFGQRPDRSHLDLPSYLELFPDWRAKRWLPVAGDGCGNYYVLLADGRVGFVDTTSDPDALDAATHADLFAFVESILINDQARH